MDDFERRIRYYSQNEVISLRRELLAVRGLKKVLLRNCREWSGFRKAYLELEARIERLAGDSVKMEEQLSTMVEKSTLSPMIDILKDVITGFDDIDTPAVMADIHEAFANIGLTEAELVEQVYKSQVLEAASESCDLAEEIGELRTMLEDMIAAVDDVETFQTGYKDICAFVDRLIMTVSKCHQVRIKAKIVVESNDALRVVWEIGDIITRSLKPLIDNEELWIDTTQDRPYEGRRTVEGYQNRQFLYVVDKIREEALRRIGQCDGMDPDKLEEWLHENVISGPTWGHDWNFRYVGRPWGDGDGYAMKLVSILDGVKGYKRCCDRLNSLKWTQEDIDKGVGYVRKQQRRGLVWRTGHWQKVDDLLTALRKRQKRWEIVDKERDFQNG